MKTNSHWVRFNKLTELDVSLNDYLLIERELSEDTLRDEDILMQLVEWWEEAGSLDHLSDASLVLNYKRPRAWVTMLWRGKHALNLEEVVSELVYYFDHNPDEEAFIRETLGLDLLQEEGSYCDHCQGTGIGDPHVPTNCPECGGRGYKKAEPEEP